MNPHEVRRDQPHSHLFTVRLWREDLGGGKSEVRMQVKHVLSGETRYFRVWSDLVDYLHCALRASDQPEQPEESRTT